MVKHILKLESLLFLLASVYAYKYFSGNWMIFILLLFTPDLSMLGYLANKKIGAILYNLVHNYALAFAALAAGTFFSIPNLIMFSLVLFAHVSLDRTIGFGLKYMSAFKDTHLQKL